MTPAPTPERVRASRLAWLDERLSERDWLLLETVNQLHLLTGLQLERLHFADLAPGRSRIVSRSRTLARLVAWHVLRRLPRRVGGPRRGSSVAVYAQCSAGQRLLLRRANSANAVSTVRSANVPSARFVAHIVAVSELHVQLVEAERRGRLQLRQLVVEPAAWWPDGRGGWLKPDALAIVGNGRIDHLWWLEVDRATESLASVERQLRRYLDFLQRGQLGPRDAMPRVLVSVPHVERQAAIAHLISRLPAPADDLFRVELHGQVVTAMAELLGRG